MQRLCSAFIAASFALAMTAEPRAQAPRERNSSTQEIERLTGRLQADSSVLNDLMADDYVRISLDGAFLSKVDVTARMKGEPSMPRVACDPQVFLFRDDIALAMCWGTTGQRAAGEPDTRVTRVFQKREDAWRLVAEELLPRTQPNLSEPLTLPDIAPLNPTLPRHPIEEEEIRAEIKRMNDLNAPQNRLGPPTPSKLLPFEADDYLLVQRDLSFMTKLQLAGQYAETERRGAAVDPGHFWTNDPNASLTYENVNVAVFGTTAVVTWRSIANGNRRAPKYTVLRLYRKTAGRWQMLAGLH